MRNTFSVSFYSHNYKEKDGLVPIYFRIIVNGKHCLMSTQQWVQKDKWNSAGKVTGYRQEAKDTNQYLDTLRKRAFEIRRELLDKGEDITADKIRNILAGRGKQSKTLIEVFDYHNIKMKELVGKEYAFATYERFETTKKLVLLALNDLYKTSDIALSELNHEFISNVNHWFRSVRNCNNNTTVKYIKNIRKMVNLAIKNGWLEKDPFIAFECHLDESKREYLTQAELNALENKSISIDRLDMVRDAFILACYSGLAYIDIANLKKFNIVLSEDGETWLRTERTKTGTNSNILLMPNAVRIIDKYKEHPLALYKGQIIPIASNQKVNSYLKELAAICGIEKNLTFHMARHTFATTVTLTNGVPIESVSKMLGHKKMTTTQIYAKVIEKKVSDDMLILKSKLNSRTS